MGLSSKKELSAPSFFQIYGKKELAFALSAEERRKFAKEDKAKRDAVRIKYSPPPSHYSRVTVSVDSSRSKSNIDVLRLCLKDLGWREYPLGKRDGNCDVYWVGATFNEAPVNLVTGAVNKFPGMVEVLRKANLTRALDTMAKLYPSDYNFYPRSWHMPAQLNEFSMCIRAMPFDNWDDFARRVFIAKPDDGSQGDGIYLFRDPDDFVIKAKQQVVQEYLSNPLLIDGFKFDLRVYAVVSSLEPLTISICREGLARFCTVPYRPPSGRNLGEMYMHLTNYSLNKHSSGYVHTDNVGDGSKRALSSVLTELGRMGHNVLQVWWDIEKVIVKTILAILPELRVEVNAETSARRGLPRCCQILGFDILILDNLRAYLLEVNANPSMRIDFEKDLETGGSEYQPSYVDECIKQPLVRDTLLLLAPRRYANKHGRQAARNSRKTARSSDDDDEFDDVTTNKRLTSCNYSNVDSYYGIGQDDATSLEEIYPSRYEESFSHLRLLEKVGAIFQVCAGIRGSSRIGASGFRAFARRHNLTDACFTSADMDLIYIEMLRKWDYLNPDRTQGLCFQGFVDAFFTIAKRKFPYTRDRVPLLHLMLDFCEVNSIDKKADKDDKLPRILAEEERIENLKKIYGNKYMPLNRRRRGINTAYVFKSEYRDKN